MTGRLYIDGKDAYLQYGAYVTQGGWNELVAMPPLKAVDYNDWQEEDGIEADLSAPVLNTREVQIKFAQANGGLSYLLSALSDGAYHDFDCRHIGREFTLRLVSEGTRSAISSLATTTLKFADDFPMRDYQYVPPFSRQPQVRDYLIDGVRFTEYGVRVLQGTLAEIEKSAAVKPNLLRNIKTASGAIYDPLNVTYKSKDVKMTCLARAESLSQLWQNYDALLYDLTRPYAHVLWNVGGNEAYYCSYKSCSVSEFYPEGKVWLKFSLTLTIYRGVTSKEIAEAISNSNVTDTSEEAQVVRNRIAGRYT